MRPDPDENDLPERLRRLDVDGAIRPLMLRSADEIERLRADRDALRVAGDAVLHAISFCSWDNHAPALKGLSEAVYREGKQGVIGSRNALRAHEQCGDTK